MENNTKQLLETSIVNNLHEIDQLKNKIKQDQLDLLNIFTETWEEKLKTFPLLIIYKEDPTIYELVQIGLFSFNTTDKWIINDQPNEYIYIAGRSKFIYKNITYRSLKAIRNVNESIFSSKSILSQLKDEKKGNSLFKYFYTYKCILKLQMLFLADLKHIFMLVNIKYNKDKKYKYIHCESDIYLGNHVIFKNPQFKFTIFIPTYAVYD